MSGQTDRWQRTRLGTVCEVLSGFAWRSEQFNRRGDGLPIIRIQNVAANVDDFVHWDGEYDPKFVIRRGDVLLTLSGSFRTCIWEGPDALLNQRIVKLTPGEQLDRRWFLYLVQTLLTQIEYMGRHALVNNVSIADLRDISFSLPPLSEQKRIAAILDKADALRRKRQQALQLTEQFLRSTFLDMFGDPVTNPKGWPTEPLKNLVRDGDKINYGVVQPGTDYPGGVPIVRVGDFRNMSIDKTSLKTIDPAIEADYRRSRLHGDEVLIACVGSIGHIAIADAGLRNFNIVRAVARVRCGGRVNRFYLACFLSTQRAQCYFASETRTVSQPTLNIKQIEETKVVLPPLSEQERFAAIFARRLAVAEEMTRSQHTIDDLFHYLVQRAFRGEL